MKDIVNKIIEERDVKTIKENFNSGNAPSREAIEAFDRLSVIWNMDSINKVDQYMKMIDRVLSY